jgi:hypothetical protein
VPIKRFITIDAPTALGSIDDSQEHAGTTRSSFADFQENNRPEFCNNARLYAKHFDKQHDRRLGYYQLKFDILVLNEKD